MKKKSLLLTAVATISLATATIAQTVPSYVPTNGLVGWWPFNGNANDESGNNNNGTVNGATLTSDRFGNTNKAYSFDGVNDFINGQLLNPLTTTGNGLTISSWINFPILNSLPQINLTNSNGSGYGIWTNLVNGNMVFSGLCGNAFAPPSMQINDINTPATNTWYSVILTCDLTTNTSKLYVNGFAVGQSNSALVQASLDLFTFGKWQGNNVYLTGDLDDIGIWNRALSQQEITDLYNGCQLSVNTQPTNQTINVNNNAQFMVGSSDPSAIYQWQTDLGVGFQNLSSVGQYSGTTTNTLTVSNVTMSNNNQPFRCIINSGSCADTSNVAILTVNNDVGINETNQGNLFSVFPNPAQSIINVKTDSKLIGSVYSIFDNKGRVVQTGKIKSENTTIELGNLSSGVYLFSVGENMKQNFRVIKE